MGGRLAAVAEVFQIYTLYNSLRSYVGFPVHC